MCISFSYLSKTQSWTKSFEKLKEVMKDTSERELAQLLVQKVRMSSAIACSALTPSAGVSAHGRPHMDHASATIWSAYSANTGVHSTNHRFPSLSLVKQRLSFSLSPVLSASASLRAGWLRLLCHSASLIDFREMAEACRALAPTGTVSSRYLLICKFIALSYACTNPRTYPYTCAADVACEQDD